MTDKIKITKSEFDEMYELITPENPSNENGKQADIETDRFEMYIEKEDKILEEETKNG